MNFEIFFIAVEIDKKAEAVKVAIFLNAVGPETVEIFNALNIEDETNKKIADVIMAFDEFCKPQKNEVYESFIFHGRQQKDNELFETFHMVSTGIWCCR